MRKHLKENIHIDVEPAYAWSDDEERVLHLCEDIKEQIQRHINDVAGVFITWEDRFVCSFCERDWEENLDPNDPDYELGMATCCLKAEDEWRELNKK